MIEREYRRKMREKDEAAQREQRLARGEPDERGQDAPAPPNLSSMQKLQRANSNFMVRSEFVDAPLTDQERCMSPAAFERLSPQKKLEIWNRAMADRRSLLR